MVKKIGFMIVVAALLVSITGCGTGKDLVGNWMEVDSGNVVVFTKDGQMGIGDDVEDLGISLRYKASKGRGEYWLLAYPDIKTAFIYSVKGDTLELTVTGGGFKGTFKRIK